MLKCVYLLLMSLDYIFNIKAQYIKRRWRLPVVNKLQEPFQYLHVIDIYSIFDRLFEIRQFKPQPSFKVIYGSIKPDNNDDALWWDSIDFLTLNLLMDKCEAI